ncbi:unnamed protein product [Linum trigynum]|uniref:Uncharacterized protein n=1 Tax=Linum trigynum TaxID=586398 RepID=A0AAV2FTK0_9ROSI
MRRNLFLRIRKLLGTPKVYNINANASIRRRSELQCIHANSQSRLPEYEEYLRNNARIRNRSTNSRLQADLIEEICSRFGDEEEDD